MTGSRPRIALAVFRLAPAGGLEQHALRLAEILVRRGAAVTLVTTRPPASAPPEGVALEQVAGRGRTNHGRLAAFAEDAARCLAGRFDAAVAFHAIPGFDVVFCADPSRAAPGPLKGLLARYAAYARLERQALGPAGVRLVMMLASAQRAGFLRNNPDASPERLVLLPPTVDRRRTAATQDRQAARAALRLTAEGPVWLWMGLQPGTKGLDRALVALAAEPAARLVVCGLDPASKSGADAGRLAERLGVAGQVSWLGFVDDAALGAAMAAADLLLHPARADVTGTVILEAMVNGLPVITTEVCGYGEHVRGADAGVVLAEPFRPADLTAALRSATPAVLRGWSQRARAYAGRDELFSGLELAADLILALAPGP